MAEVLKIRLIQFFLGIEGMANGIVRGINKVIDVLNNLKVHVPDWVPLFGGKDIGFNINHMGEVSLPRLAKGNVAYEETVAVFGEYAGASYNPEITAPRNTIKEVVEEALANQVGSKQSLNLNLYVSNKKLGQILIDDLRDLTRQTGQGIEAFVK